MGGQKRISESVKCRFSKYRFSVLDLKFDFISDGGRTREKQIQKALGSLPPCGNRCRCSESAISSSRVHPPSEMKSNFKFKNTKVASPKVAFDTVRVSCDIGGGKTYHRVSPPKPVLEASESGICLVCAGFL